MVNIIKQEIVIEESLKKKLELICEFSNTTLKIINGSIRKIDRTNLTYVEPHRIIINDITFLAFNYSNEIFIENLCNKMKLSDLEDYLKTPLYNEAVSLSKVMVYKKKIPVLKNAEITLYGDKIVINEARDNEINFPFDTVSAVTILGKNKLNIYYDGEIYQIKGSKRFNALKYVHIFNRFQNVSRGVLNGEFLGL